MAKGKIFIGEIMADMVTALGSIDDTMISQITKIDEQITELQEINNSVGQSIQTGKIAAGTENVLILNDTEINTNGTVTKEIGAAKVYADGSLKIGAMIRRVGTNSTLFLKYAINAGAQTNIGTVPTANGSFELRETTITVSANDIVRLYITGVSGNDHLVYQANSGKIEYDLVNVATDGYIIKI